VFISRILLMHGVTIKFIDVMACSCIHIGDIFFICEVCRELSTVWTSLTHTHIHSGFKPFKCKVLIKVSPDLPVFWLTLTSILVKNLSIMKLYNKSCME